MEEESIKRSRKKTANDRTRKTIIIAAGIVFGLVILIIGGFIFALNHYLDKINYKELQSDYTVLESVETMTQGETGVEETSLADTPENEILKYQQAAKEALEALGEEVRDLDGVYNVLLVGSDSRAGGAAVGNSDTCMLLSLNFETGEIILTSFLRDLYVYIPRRDTFDKLNSAYQYGGIELLMETIQYNFSIAVDDYVSVDFFAFMKVVDIIGGIDVDVQEDELYWLNMYIHANNLLLEEEDEFADYLDYADGSFQHLNGKQALAYARFRYVGNADFTRTERQRKILNLTFEKLKTIDINTLLTLLDQILPEITTNIDKGYIIELMAKIPVIKDFDMVSWSIPDTEYEYINRNGQSSLAIDFNYYVNRMYEYIYGNGEEETAQ